MNVNQINNKSFIITLLVGMIFGLSSCSNSKEAPAEAVKAEASHEEEIPTIATLTADQIKTVGIQYGEVELKQLTATIKANGNLKVPNNNKAQVTSLYGGVIRTLKIQVGSYVKKGQVIATIANPTFIKLQEEYLQLKNQTDLGSNDNTSLATNPQYAGIQEELRSIDPKIDMAQLEVNRQTELNEANIGALKNLQQAKTDLAVLQSRKVVLQNQLATFGKSSNATILIRKNAIETELTLMGINPNSINNSNLKSTLDVASPINGTISNVLSKIGSYADVSSPIAEIVDNEQLHLDLNVFEKDLPMLKVGQTIHFTLTNNPTNEYDAEVYSIGTAFENESKTIPIHANVKGNKTGLIDGMNITALVSLNNVTTPAVPNEAIVEADGKTYIFVITDKKPEEHPVEEGKEPKKEEGLITFEKIEVLRGVSNLGFTAVSFVTDIPQGAKIVSKGAFFINAKLTNTEEE